MAQTKSLDSRLTTKVKIGGGGGQKRGFCIENPLRRGEDCNPSLSQITQVTCLKRQTLRVCRSENTLPYREGCF